MANAICIGVMSQGKTVHPDLVKRAREEYMKHIRNLNVYCKVPIEQCVKATGKSPIGTRWVDINKSDDANPQYRSRLVAKEVNTYKRRFVCCDSAVGSTTVIAVICRHKWNWLWW